MLSPLYKKNNAHIKLNFKKEIYLNIDYLRIKQVFINILKNSLEAKPENRDLEVTIDVKENKNNIKIIVKDNGIGMNKDTLNNIYKIFYTTKENGNGLGTILSKEIIEMHHGTIKYLSIPDKGTTVIVTLPYNKKKSFDF